MTESNAVPTSNLDTSSSRIFLILFALFMGVLPALGIARVPMVPVVLVALIGARLAFAIARRAVTNDERTPLEKQLFCAVMGLSYALALLAYAFFAYRC